MSVVINTNTAASIAANNLGYANDQLTDAINQLSSGSRLVNPATDPGSVGVSLQLSAAAADQGVASTVAQNQLSFYQTQDGVLNVAGSIVTQISELATEANDPTKSASDVSNYNTEFSSLLTELGTLSGDTFNNVALFGSSGVNLGGVSTTIGTSLAGTSITTALANVASMIAANGAQQATLGFQSQAALSNQTNLEAANSAISDVDVAQESTQLARWNVLVQAGTAMLAQANQTTSIALKLLE